jgi:hypothetical protein
VRFTSLKTPQTGTLTLLAEQLTASVTVPFVAEQLQSKVLAELVTELAVPPLQRLLVGVEEKL